MSEPVHVLIVARQTAKNDRLLEAVRVRSQHGPARFHLLVPRLQPHGKRRLVDAVGVDDEESHRVLEEALPLLSRAAGSEVTGSLGVPGPMTAIQAEVERDRYDEVIISTLPRRISRWLKLDLVSKTRPLGLPVTHVEAADAPARHSRPVTQGDGAPGSDPARVLVVAHRTAATERLLEAVRQRVERGPACFHLVVPRMPKGSQELTDPDEAGDNAARRVLEEALPRLSEAAGREVSGSLGDSEPLMAIQDALKFGQYDEVIISTLPPRVSRWLRLDLVSKTRGLGLPVTHVEAVETPAPA